LPNRQLAHKAFADNLPPIAVTQQMRATIDISSTAGGVMFRAETWDMPI
jgi:hypothetical protein